MLLFAKVQCGILTSWQGLFVYHPPLEAINNETRGTIQTLTVSTHHLTLNTSNNTKTNKKKRNTGVRGKCCYIIAVGKFCGEKIGEEKITTFSIFIKL